MNALKQKYYQILLEDGTEEQTYEDFCMYDYPDAFTMIYYLDKEDIPQYCEENGFDIDTFLEITDKKYIYFYNGW